MVYIYKKMIGERPYYYLRASERKGTRVIVKDIAYLGNSIDEVRSSLDTLTQFKDKIRKAYKTIHGFLESNHFLEKAVELKLKEDSYLGDNIKNIEACRIHYNTVFNKNDALTKKEILKNFIIEYAFNTTSIEGNTISLNEARNLLQEGSSPKDKTLREIYDVQNTQKVFFWLLEEKKEICHELIIKIHSGLMENIDARKGYRTSDVRVLKANFKSTPAPYVKTDMDLLIKWHDKMKKEMHPLVLGSIFHHKFEKIHPFMDGNGRTGRMLVNYILMKSNYPPMIIHKKFRQEYLDALRVSDKAGIMDDSQKYYRQLISFITEEMTGYYWDLFL